MKLHALAASPVVRTICPMRFLLAFAQSGLLSPILPLLRESFQVTYAQLGLLTSVFGLSCVVMDAVATYLVGHRSVFSVLLQGITITAIGMLGCVLAPSFYWLVGARALLGFGVSMTGVASLITIMTATPRTAQGQASSVLEFSAIAGLMFSPTLSGLIATVLHWRAACGLAMVFVVAALGWVLWTRRSLQEAITAPSEVVPPATPDTPEPLLPPAFSSSAPRQRQTIVIAYLSTFVLSFIWAGFLSTALPLFGGDTLHISPTTLGLVLTVGLLVDLLILLPVGWLSDRLQPRLVLAPALVLLATALYWLPAARNLTALLLVSIALHTSFAAWGMPSAALTLSTSGTAVRRAMGIYRLLVDSAVVIAPWLIGTLIEHYGYNLPAQIAALATAGTALLVWHGLRT